MDCFKEKEASLLSYSFIECSPCLPATLIPYYKIYKVLLLRFESAECKGSGSSRAKGKGKIRTGSTNYSSRYPGCDYTYLYCCDSDPDSCCYTSPSSHAPDSEVSESVVIALGRQRVTRRASGRVTSITIARSRTRSRTRISGTIIRILPSRRPIMTIRIGSSTPGGGVGRRLMSYSFWWVVEWR